MTASNAFSLRIFVADGDPDGLRVVERSNWIGKALMFPRALLPQVKQRPELGQAGVYLLLGPREDGAGEMLYIGEGDPIRPRLESHYAQKDFWTRAVCFVATPGQLNKAHVQFLESNLVRLAKAAKRLPLDNANHPAEPSLSEADRADMLVFLDNVLGMLPVLGVGAFELASAPPKPVVDLVAPPAPTQTTRVFTCRGKGVLATGFEATQGFVVQAGSQAVVETVPSIQTFPGSTRLRQDLIANGVLVSDGSVFRFSQDYIFSSPSSASDLVLGSVTNGRTSWKDASGRTLKEVQAIEARA
jgi:hypothetical protein